MKYSDYYIKNTNAFNKNNPIDISFIEWIDKVETLVYNYTGYYLLELSDEPYMIMFEQNLTPTETSQYCISNTFFVKNFTSVNL
jgi:hypothetical protein